MYQALFRYLLAVERASRALDEVWQHVMTHMRSSRRNWATQSKQASSTASSGADGTQRGGRGAAAVDGKDGESSYSRKTLGAGLVGHACASAVLRHRMDCVVRHLKGYLGDVVTRLFVEAEQDMVSAKTFVEVQNAHETLLTNLKLQTFLTSQHMCEVIEALLQGCGMLCKCAPFCISDRLSAVLAHEQAHALLGCLQALCACLWRTKSLLSASLYHALTWYSIGPVFSVCSAVPFSSVVSG